VTPKADGSLEVAGDLTMHGVTKHITIPVRFLGAKNKKMKGGSDFAGFDAEFTIDRTEFGINGSRWSGAALILSKDVNLQLAMGAVLPGSE
jgi:polyisoprenoid-binding protein YceI